MRVERPVEPVFSESEMVGITMETGDNDRDWSVYWVEDKLRKINPYQEDLERQNLSRILDAFARCVGEDVEVEYWNEYWMAVHTWLSWFNIKVVGVGETQADLEGFEIGDCEIKNKASGTEKNQDITEDEREQKLSLPREHLPTIEISSLEMFTSKLKELWCKLVPLRIDEVRGLPTSRWLGYIELYEMFANAGTADFANPEKFLEFQISQIDIAKATQRSNLRAFSGGMRGKRWYGKISLVDSFPGVEGPHEIITSIGFEDNNLGQEHWLPAVRFGRNDRVAVVGAIQDVTESGFPKKFAEARIEDVEQSIVSICKGLVEVLEDRNKRKVLSSILGEDLEQYRNQVDFELLEELVDKLLAKGIDADPSAGENLNLQIKSVETLVEDELINFSPEELYGKSSVSEGDDEEDDVDLFMFGGYVAYDLLRAKKMLINRRRYQKEIEMFADRWANRNRITRETGIRLGGQLSFLAALWYFKEIGVNEVRVPGFFPARAHEVAFDDKGKVANGTDNLDEYIVNITMIRVTLEALDMVEGVEVEVDEWNQLVIRFSGKLRPKAIGEIDEKSSKEVKKSKKAKQQARAYELVAGILEVGKSN